MVIEETTNQPNKQTNKQHTKIDRHFDTIHAHSIIARTRAYSHAHIGSRARTMPIKNRPTHMPAIILPMAVKREANRGNVASPGDRSGIKNTDFFYIPLYTNKSASVWSLVSVGAYVCVV